VGAGLLAVGESSQSIKTLTALAAKILALMCINCSTGLVRKRSSLNFNRRILLVDFEADEPSASQRVAKRFFSLRWPQKSWQNSLA